MSYLEWTIIRDSEEFLGEYGPSCPGGPASHTWTLTVEEGQLAFSSGCSDCDVWFCPETEFLWVAGEVRGRLEFHPDHPNLGGWHYDQRCDCGWTWEFVPQTAWAEGERP